MDREQFDPTRVVDLEFSSQDGIVLYRQKFADGKTGPWEQTTATLDDRNLREFRDKLYRDAGLEPPTKKGQDY